MKQNKTKKTSRLLFAGLITACCLLLAQGGNAQNAGKARSFSSPQEAADALIDAAEKYDEAALTEILGPDSYDIIHTGEPARDREVSQKFAEQARIKTNVALQP